MPEPDDPTKALLTALNVQVPPIRSLPESLRAWIAIGASIAAGSLIVCTIFSAILLVRLGWDALSLPSPNNQEATKNFLLAFASTFGAPFIIWRTWVAHQQAKAAAEQARVALENHITGIFAKSVELMGLVRETQSQNATGELITRSSPNIESRLGALYSLERLLIESKKDQRAILETLCAYVRENSPLEIPDNEAEASLFRSGDLPPAPTRRGDVQAAITIIGRRPLAVQWRAENEGWRLDFRNANLVAYDFSNLNFDNADFDNSFLNGSNMAAASFAHCIFNHCLLRSADMTRASFRSSTFDGCKLNNAKLDATDFRLVTFIDTDLRDAKVISFDIRGANLEGAFWLFALQAALDGVKKDPKSYHALDIVKIWRLFKKANFDEETEVPEVVRHIMALMPSNFSQ